MAIYTLFHTLPIGLAYAYSSGGALVARGVAMYAPGWTYSSGLILTRTAKAFGRSPMAWGQRMTGMSMINQGSASMATIASPSLSKAPGGNIYAFLTNDGFAGCSG